MATRKRNRNRRYNPATKSNPDTGKLVMYLGLAAAAYLAWNWWSNRNTAGASGAATGLLPGAGAGTGAGNTVGATAPPSTVGSTAPGASAPTTPTTTPTPATIAARIQAAAGGASSLNLDQWAYFAQQIAGKQLAPDPFFGPAMASRTVPTSYAQWEANGGAAYLSALGLGMSGFHTTPSGRVAVGLAGRSIASPVAVPRFGNTFGGGWTN